MVPKGQSRGPFNLVDLRNHKSEFTAKFFGPLFITQECGARRFREVFECLDLLLEAGFFVRQFLKLIDCRRWCIWGKKVVGAA